MPRQRQADRGNMRYQQVIAHDEVRGLFDCTLLAGWFIEHA